MRSVEFSIVASVPESHFVGIVGNRVELGEWTLQNAKEMRKMGSNRWQTLIQFDSPGNIMYRYFVGRKVKTSTKKEYLAVKYWESGPESTARIVLHFDEPSVLHKDDHEFGQLSHAQIEGGWLSGQSEVRFTFSQNGEAPLISLSQNINCLPIESLSISFCLDCDVLSSHVTHLKFSQSTECTVHSKAPLPKEAEVLTYVIEACDLASFSGKFVIYQDTKIIGYAAVTSDMLAESSTSYIQLAILNESFNVIGSLHTECVVIHTYANQTLLNMREGFCSHWKERPTLHIGHRGCGNSFTAKIPSDMYENTMLSFKTASEHGADMIEFDVQLTKDKIPIVFHDFTICTDVNAKQGSKSTLLEVEVQSLTYDELMNCKLRHRARKSPSSVDPVFDEDSNEPDLRPFPTFQEVFEKVPGHTGFDIELKWPEYNQDKSYSHGVEKFCDANEFVDKILDVVFTYCGSRRIVFSTFDTNICTFLKRKQNRFPVIFLMDEGSTFMDLRSRHNGLAIPFAASEKFAGICFCEQSAFADNIIVTTVHNQNLRCFFYGDHVGEEDNRRMLCQRGADGIIYDRIHQTSSNCCTNDYNLNYVSIIHVMGYVTAWLLFRYI